MVAIWSAKEYTAPGRQNEQRMGDTRFSCDLAGTYPICQMQGFTPGRKGAR
jgi:hypothetical protein